MRFGHTKFTGCVVRRGCGLSPVSDAVWAALCEGGLLLTVGLAGIALRVPLLFASLGPTAYEQVELPKQSSSRPYNIITGHLAGMGAGFLGIALADSWKAPNVLASGELLPSRVWACVTAAAVTTFMTLILRARQPAALATTLLVASGAFQTRRDALIIIAGVLLLTAIGEPVRRFRLNAECKRQPPS